MREAPHEFKQTAFHILVAISFGVVVFVLVGTTPERQVGLQTSMSFARSIAAANPQRQVLVPDRRRAAVLPPHKVGLVAHRPDPSLWLEDDEVLADVPNTMSQTANGKKQLHARPLLMGSMLVAVIVTAILWTRQLLVRPQGPKQYMPLSSMRILTVAGEVRGSGPAGKKKKKLSAGRQAYEEAKAREEQMDQENDEAVDRAERLVEHEAQTTMPPGTYFIGDPCLVTEWAAVYEQVYGSEDGIVYIRDHKTVAFHTAAGDGKFLDNDEHSYLINSGMIMMAPLEALRVRDHLEDVGRVWTTDVEVEVSRTKEGLMTFGDVKIVTSEDFEEEDLGEDIDASEFDIGEDEDEDEEEEDDEEELDMAVSRLTKANVKEQAAQEKHKIPNEEAPWDKPRDHKELPWNSTMPPGEYWVGDPAIVFTEHNDFDWDQVSQIMKENRGRPWEQDGETVCALPCAPSKNGVWTYEDEDETQYPCPSGFLAMIPTPLLRRQAPLAVKSGRVWTAQKEVKVCLSAQYQISFGPIKIDTDVDANSRERGHVLEEGTYYIGDPKWAFTDDNGFDWKEVKDILELSEDDEMRIKGEHVSCFYTVLGKGWFQDNAGQKYHLESGLIAVVPVSLLDNPNTSQLKKHGRVVEFEDPIGLMQEETGLVHIGPYKIDTAKFADGEKEETNLPLTVEFDADVLKDTHAARDQESIDV
jgi:hypothetical protein